MSHLFLKNIVLHCGSAFSRVRCRKPRAESRSLYFTPDHESAYGQPLRPDKESRQATGNSGISLDIFWCRGDSTSVGSASLLSRLQKYAGCPGTIRATYLPDGLYCSLTWTGTSSGFHRDFPRDFTTSWAVNFPMSRARLRWSVVWMSFRSIL